MSFKLHVTTFVSIFIFQTTLFSQDFTPPNSSGLPEVDAGKIFMEKSISNSNTQLQDLKDKLSSESQYPVKLVDGQTIDDLMNKANASQAESQRMLDNQKSTVQNGAGTNNFDIHQAIHETFDNIHNNQSFGSKNQPLNLSTSSSTEYSGTDKKNIIDNNTKNIDRYLKSPCFQSLGFIPSDPNLEQKYLACEAYKRNSELIKYAKIIGPIIIGLILFFYILSFINKKNMKAFETVPLNYYASNENQKSSLYNIKTISKSVTKKPVAKKSELVKTAVKTKSLKKSEPVKLTKKNTSLKNTKPNQDISGTKKASTTENKKTTSSRAKKKTD